MSSEHLRHPHIDGWLDDAEQTLNEYAEIADADEIAISAWEGMKASIEAHYYTERDGRATYAKWFGEETLNKMIQKDLETTFQQLSFDSEGRYLDGNL